MYMLASVFKNISKRTLMPLLLVAFPPSALSQSHITMLKEGRTWQVKDHIESIDYDDGDEVVYGLTLSGDTVINGRTWKRLVRDGGTFELALREEDQKVWATDGEREQLFYDFSLSVGDQFDPYPPMPYNENLIVTKTDTVCVGGTPRKRIWFTQGWYVKRGIITFVSNIWVEGIGAYWGPFCPSDAIMNGNRSALMSCHDSGELLFSLSDFKAPAVEGSETYRNKCATPTIAYERGRLMFSCETPGAECFYQITCRDRFSGSGSEAAIDQTYTISFYAHLEGWFVSDTATATISWRNGQPVMEGFSSVTMDGEDSKGDVNCDGKIDVADIAKVLSIMAGCASK